MKQKEKIKAIPDLITLLGKTKEDKMNWGKNHKESISSRAYSELLLTLLYCPANVDMLKCFKMIVANVFDNQSDIPSGDLRHEFWELRKELESLRSNEASFVYDICLLAGVLHYEYYHKNNPEDFETSAEFFRLLRDMPQASNKRIAYFIEHPEKLADLTEILGKFKEVLRKGHVIRGIKVPENDADHSFSLVFLLIFFHEAQYNLLTEIILAIIHDLPEFSCGDVTGIDIKNGIITEEEKLRRELEAMQYIAKVLNRPVFLEYYNEYCEGKTMNAKRVKSLDKIDFCISSKYYVLENKHDPNCPETYEGILESYRKSGKIKDLLCLGILASL